MLKIYKCSDGFTRRFEEGTQPADAVEVKPVETKTKKAPANKSRQPKNK